MNAIIKNSNDLTAIIKANDKFNKMGEKFLTLEERELIERTSDIYQINRLSIIFSILFTDYDLTVEQLNNLYKKAVETEENESRKNIEYVYKLNTQCQELKENGVDIERLFKGG